MSNSMFSRGFQGRPFMGQSIAPITLAVYSRDLTMEQLRTYLLDNTTPAGKAAGGARVVKILDGEFLVYPDGTAQFVQVGRNPGPLFEYRTDRIIPGILGPDEEVDYFRGIRPESLR